MQHIISYIFCNREKRHHSSILESAAKRQRVDDELHTKSTRGQRRTKDKDKETQEKKPVTMVCQYLSFQIYLSAPMFSYIL